MNERDTLGPPPEWKDDQTMVVLFSPFRDSRNVNPNSWDRKLQFWSQAIVRKCQFERTAVFNARQLPAKFERKGKVPFCLGIVLKNMIKNGQICLLSNATFAEHQTWARWSYGMLVKWPVQTTFNIFVKKPIAWTFSKLFSGNDGLTSESSTTSVADSTHGLDDNQYVVTEVVKYLAEQIQKVNTENSPDSARMVSLAALRQKCMTSCPDDTSFQLAVGWLCAEKRCLVVDVDGLDKVVVFADVNQKVCEPLSESEIITYKLNCSTNQINEQIDAMRQEMESLRLEAKSCLQRGMKMSAKNLLRRKKRLEQQQDKKEAALENIHQLLVTIQQAQSDKQVLDAYSSGVSAYKDMTKKYGLTADAVDDVMLGVQEVLEAQDDLNRSIAMPLSPDDMTSDDLDQELKDILDVECDLPDIPQAEPHQEMIDSLCQMKIVEDELPAVPNHIPGSPQSASSPHRVLDSPHRDYELSPQAVPMTTAESLKSARKCPEKICMSHKSPQSAESLHPVLNTMNKSVSDSKPILNTE